MESQNTSRILDQIAQAKLSVDQALSALRRPGTVVQGNDERDWFPLWLRIVISEGGGKGIRLRIPIFFVLPLVLAVFLLLLPLLLIALLVLTLTLRGRVASHIPRLIVPISMAMVQLCFCGRGAGVEVIDGEDEVIVRLE
jgi:hypothetical protein